MLIILKIFLLFFIILLCTKIGILKAKTYDNRVVELKKMKSSLEVLRSKIEFTYEPIKDIFLEISNIVYHNTDNIFSRTIEQMNKKAVYFAWNEAVEEENNLNPEDKETIKMFGKLLGKTDKNGQINEINVTTKLLDVQIEKAESEKNKNFKLFRSLGVTVGIGICIILI